MAVGNSHICKHFPLAISQSLIWLSADPDTNNLVWAARRARKQVSKGCDQFYMFTGWLGCMKRYYPRTVTRDCPDGTVVAVVGSESLSVRREPSIDDMILRGGKQKVTLFVVHDLGERTLVSCIEGRGR